MSAARFSLQEVCTWRLFLFNWISSISLYISMIATWWQRLACDCQASMIIFLALRSSPSTECGHRWRNWASSGASNLTWSHWYWVVVTGMMSSAYLISGIWLYNKMVNWEIIPQTCTSTDAVGIARALMWEMKSFPSVSVNGSKFS